MKTITIQIGNTDDKLTQDIVDYVTRACIKCGKPQCQCIELSMGIPPEAYEEGERQ